MAKDPAFLFYPGDWQGGTSTFSRFLKGCYLDVLIAQFNSGHLSLEEIKTVLGSDFGQAWPTLQKKFQKDSDGLFFNEKLDTEITKRKEYSKSRSENRTGKGKKTYEKDMLKTSGTYVKHMENGNENADDDLEKLKEYDVWTDQILEGDDHLFHNMFSRESIPPGEHVKFLILDHRDLLNRYPKMRPSSQHAFRNSCMKHIRENYKKSKSEVAKLTYEELK
jgi:hypothetical protein